MENSVSGYSISDGDRSTVTSENQITLEFFSKLDEVWREKPRGKRQEPINHFTSGESQYCRQLENTVNKQDWRKTKLEFVTACALLSEL